MHSAIGGDGVESETSWCLPTVLLGRRALLEVLLGGIFLPDLAYQILVRVVWSWWID